MMNEYISELIVRLRIGTTEKFRDGSSETVSTALEREAADALEAQAIRIAELEWTLTLSVEKDTLKLMENTDL